MARLNQYNTDGYARITGIARYTRIDPIGRESVARAPSDNIVREFCEKIEHGGKRSGVGRRGRRAISSDEELLRFFPSKKEDFDIDKVKKVLTNIYHQLIYHCVDHCEDFAFLSNPEAFCRRKVCVHKSLMKVLARMLNNEIQFQIVKERPKIRKRRIEID